MSQLRIIKKYPNRRLYDTEISSYVTLEDVRQLIVDGESFEVRDARTGADLTRSVLLQILAEHEDIGQPIFSTQLLTTVIRFYGDSLQGIIGSYLERSIQLFSEQQQQLRGTLGNLVVQAPWQLLNQLADKNMEIWRGVQQGIIGGYLERSIQLFSEQQQQLRGTLGSVVQAPWSLLNQLAEKNMEIWKGVQQGIKSGLAGDPPKPEDTPRSAAARARRRNLRR